MEWQFSDLDELPTSGSQPPASALDANSASAISRIVAAASQLVAIFHISSCLRAVIEGNLFEIIQTAGSKGIHVNDIAKQSKTDPMKTARILRLLASNHMFTELEPDVFRANRLSSVLVSGRSVEELQAKYESAAVLGSHLPPSPVQAADTRVGEERLAALVLMHTDESFKGAAYLSEAFTDPITAHSSEATHSPWNIATETNLHLFKWYDEPENAALKTRFSLAMEAATKLEPAEAILSGFEWNNLPQDSVVVDVGGGVGSTSLILAKAIPHISLVVQDRPSVIADAKKYWSEKAPELLESNRVKLEAHDFFVPMVNHNASVFLLRWILHDWPDALAIKILQNLRQAALPETKLITVDVLIPYTCADSACDESKIPGASRPAAPEPLLANGGAASSLKYLLDMQMFVLGNCHERTLNHFVSIATRSGWKVVQVHHIIGSSLSQCVSVPMV
ncbi:O-methyltransferase [Mycena amicta]|nr:O-methyltransferase [Mycena amicta]